MKVHTDYHFVIGNLHVKQNSPCQDHALGAVRTDAGIIALADGCSKQPHTDIGARILTCSTIVTLNEYLLQPSFAATDTKLPLETMENIRMLSMTSKRLLGLRKEHLDATCLYALLTENGGFAHVIGDGYVILKYKDGSIESHGVEWQNSMPYYLAYTPKDIEELCEKHGKLTTTNDHVAITIRNFSPEKKVTTSIVTKRADECINGYVVTIDKDKLLRGLEYVVLSSDGLGSFRENALEREDGNAVSIESTVLEMAAFKKATEGEFVKRRLTRMLENYHKAGILPSDDVSCAAIHIDHSENKES